MTNVVLNITHSLTKLNLTSVHLLANLTLLSLYSDKHQIFPKHCPKNKVFLNVIIYIYIICVCAWAFITIHIRVFL